jgi:hypothetical protein
MFRSYLEDFSYSFEKGLSRFREIKTKEKPNYFQKFFSQNFDYDQLVSWEFYKTIDELYVNTIRERLHNLICGEMKFNFLGGSPQDLFLRVQKNYSIHDSLIKKFYHYVTQDIFTTLILFNEDQRNIYYQDVLANYYNSKFIYRQIGQELYDDQFVNDFLPLKFFKIYLRSIDQFLLEKKHSNYGLIEYLSNHYRGTYTYSERGNTTLHQSHGRSAENQNEDQEDQIHVYLNPLHETEIRDILKIFLEGKKILLNEDALSEESKRKIEVFILENKLKNLKMKYVVDFRIVLLGDSIICFFSGSDLEKSSLGNKFSFWEHIFSFFKIKHLMIDADPDVLYYWQRRDAKINESQFSEIRRLTCLNYTTGKRRVYLPVIDFLKPIRVIHQRSSQFEQSLLSSEILMEECGLFVLDFGHMDEELK